MTARIQNATPQPHVTTGVQHLFKAVYAGGVPHQTLELVHLRASQINGCSACVDAGAASAAKAGVSPEKLVTVAAWYERRPTAKRSWWIRAPRLIRCTIDPKSTT
jgi:AhpD family alkylhydroperoxidase